MLRGFERKGKLWIAIMSIIAIAYAMIIEFSFWQPIIIWWVIACMGEIR